MARSIRINVGGTQVQARLNDTETAQAVWKALPIRASAHTWGDEVYFSIPVKMAQEKAQEVVDLGDIAYWPPGNAFCIFFGPTPASRGNEIRPASAVTVIGQVQGDATVLKQVMPGASILIDTAL